jgi:hypothetical protein
VNLGIIVPLIVLPIIIVGVFVWYRRSMSAMTADDAKPISGLRLTAEALHRASSPPWRVVYEIGGALGAVDHVVVGPAGVIAISTLVADRPEPRDLLDARSEAQLVSDAAIARGPIDELLRAVDASCSQSAKVFWGAPDPNRPTVEPLVHGSQLVEGQRLEEWLAEVDRQATARLDPARVDEVWRTIVIGIGRPDPLP